MDKQKIVNFLIHLARIYSYFSLPFAGIWLGFIFIDHAGQAGMLGFLMENIVGILSSVVLPMLILFFIHPRVTSTVSPTSTNTIIASDKKDRKIAFVLLLPVLGFILGGILFILMIAFAFKAIGGGQSLW